MSRLLCIALLWMVVGCTGDPRAIKPFHKFEFSQRDRDIAQKYAPVLFHELGSIPKFDSLTRIDFDGDFIGSNNWQNSATMPMPAYVYYSVVETVENFFIFYGTYHPRDYARVCLPILCHENDFEGAMVTVRKGTSTSPESIEYVETQAHDAFYLYRPYKVKDPKGRERLALYVESEGHGVYQMRGKDFIHKQACEAASAKVPYGLHRTEDDLNEKTARLYWPGEAADVPENQKRGWFSYKLLPLSEFWNRLGEPENRLLAQFPFDYQGATFQLKGLPLSFFSDDYVVRELGPAKPPWAWPDRKCKDLKRGDWFLDPAKSLRAHLGEPVRGGDIYLNHPYAKILTVVSP